MGRSKKIPCWFCNCAIPSERVKFLKGTSLHESEYTCVNHSQTKAIKGIYMGEHGTSEMKLCDKVYNDSVRSKFRDPEDLDDDSAEESPADVD